MAVTEDKKALLKQLLEKKAAAGATHHTFPLSYGQRALWFLHQNAPANTAYHVALTARIRSAVDQQAWKKSCQRLVNRHPILRTTYDMQKGEVVQKVHAFQEVAYHFADVAHLDEADFRKLVVDQYEKPFNLEAGPVVRFYLFRRGEENYVLLINIHHIACDGVSTWLMLEELKTLYAAEVEGTKPALPALPLTYKDFVQYQRDLLQSDKGEELLDYWKQQLSGPLPLLELPLDKTRPDVQTYKGDSVDLQLEPGLVERLRVLGKEQGVTIFVTLLSAYQLLLSKYSGQDDLIVGTPTTGRDKADFQPIAGYFVNPIALRANFSDNPGFSDYLLRNRDTVLQGIRHQELPFPYLVEKLQVQRDKGRSPIFQVFFSLLKSQGDEAVQAVMAGSEEDGKVHDWGKLKIQPFELNQQEGQFDLTLALTESKGAVMGRLKYNPDLFEKATMERMTRHYVQLLEEILEHPHRPVHELELMTAQEKYFFTDEINHTQTWFPQDKCMHEIFESRVDQQPNDQALSMPALEDSDRKSSYTYAELDAAANQLAHALQAKGVAPEVKVGLSVHRSPEMVIAMLGILKAGGAYVPLDPDYPTDRIRYIAEDSGLEWVLTMQGADERLPEEGMQRLYLDTGWSTIADYPDTRPDSKVGPENLSYIIYTSGSTGKPKGVLIEHRGVVNKLLNFKQDITFTPEYRFTLLASYAFDASIGQLFMPLCQGCPVFLLPKSQQNDPEAFWDFIEKTGVNVLYTVASFLSPMLDVPRDLSHLDIKAVFLGAEVFPLPLLEKIRKRLRVDYIVNMYGPTEATVNCVMHTVKGTPKGSIPLGGPLPNYTVYVRDAYGNICPPGVTGEIQVGGAAIARGYHNRPELTEERFIPDPFSEKEGARLYKSGDLGKYLPNGDIAFMGRVDKQVKVNGYRIEPGEVEAAMLDHNEVKEALVTARPDHQGNARLIGYMILQPNCQAPTPQSMRDFLQDRLPSYMVPSAFVAIEKFPLTPTGKIDLNALPEPGIRPDMGTEYVAPRNEAEAYMVNIWQEVLGIPKIGVNDNFFELGGASVQSIQVVNRANEIGFELNANMIFEHQTVAQLAAAGPFSYKEPSAEAEVIPEKTTSASQEEVSYRPSIGTDKANTIVESIGTYLPDNVVSTQELLDACKVNIRFPIEKMTGIKTRRSAGGKEFAIDMAIRAAEDAFSRSKYEPEEIELLICCNISRYDAPTQVSFEPSTAIKLVKHFGMKNPLVFDLSNACATMWTGINIADSFITNGIVKRAMVVSGEYITHIADTAVKEIENDFMDRRMACLTVGDSGAAVIVEKAPSHELGFHYLHMFTETELCRNCIAHITDQLHGGAIMYVESVKAAASAIQPGAALALNIIQKGNWLPQPKFNHILIHQTSSTTISDARREINSLYNQKIATPENTIDNIAHRGNTATTSHWVATVDRIRKGEIEPGHKMVFGISGSGHTLGTALYSFDDLPERIRKNRKNERTSVELAPPRSAHWPVGRESRVAIAGLGTLPEDYQGPASSMEYVKEAAKQAIADSGYDKNEIGLIIHTGVYRDKFLSEPAVAALMAGDLGINLHPEIDSMNKSFTFDLVNGAMGFLQACYVGIQMLEAGKFHTAMVTSSEVENNKEVRPDKLLGLQETGGAMVLHFDDDHSEGFGNFAFRSFPEYLETRTTFGTWKDGAYWLEYIENPNQDSYYAACIAQTVQEFLAEEGLHINDLDRIFPPQLSASFLDELAVALDIPRERLIDTTQEKGDLFTASLPVSLQHARQSGWVQKGDKALLIQVAAGIQVGCAMYYF